ncbi:hypothetical protein ACQ4LE_001616 [Meloidogyne hapla]
MPEHSTQINVLSNEQSLTNEKEEKLRISSENFNSQKIRDIIVLPPPEIINTTNEVDDIDKTLVQMAEFMFEKTNECRQVGT